MVNPMIMGVMKAEGFPPSPQWWGLWHLLVPDGTSLLPPAYLWHPSPKLGLGNAQCLFGPALAVDLACWTFRPVETSQRIYLSAKACSTCDSSWKGVSRSRIFESNQTKCTEQLLFAAVMCRRITFSLTRCWFWRKRFEKSPHPQNLRAEK